MSEVSHLTCFAVFFIYPINVSFSKKNCFVGVSCSLFTNVFIIVENPLFELSHFFIKCKQYLTVNADLCWHCITSRER